MTRSSSVGSKRNLLRSLRRSRYLIRFGGFRGAIEMDRFIINKNAQANGDHEVHNVTRECSYMPNSENQVDLGYHASCHGAVAVAKTQWPEHRINGCYYCCKPCHTT